MLGAEICFVQLLCNVVNVKSYILCANDIQSHLNFSWYCYLFLKMNQNLNDDLEEGEIADDIMPEPIIEKKIKALPRRYTINERKNTPKHKKNCKHASQHRYRNNKWSFFSNSNLPKKHHRACPKRKTDWYGNVSVDSFPLASEKSLAGGLSDRRSTYDYRKPSSVKSAFKNFTSPPRKVSKLNNFTCHSTETIDNFPSLLSEYKNSRDELKFKNISNLKKQDKNLCKTTVDKGNILVLKQESSENLPPSENSVHNSDDEDEEELRRIALATCAKRLPTEVIEENINSCDKSSTTNINTPGTDNYEVVDMDIDEESENVENVDNLFVIDTTPTYFGELHQQTLNNNFGYNLGSDLNTGLQNNGFISCLNIEEPFQNFNGNVINHNLNNDLYLTNFSPILVNESNPPPSQLNEDFEEELLRAELIANINSIRKKAEHCMIENKIIPGQNVAVDSQIGIDLENKVDKNENNFKAIRTINLVNDSRKENSFNERIVSIENKVSEVEPCFQERTVSIVGDSTKKESFFKEKTRNNSALYSKHDVPKTFNASKRNGVDIKVKLNNMNSTASSANTTKKLILPQERIIISLNNESSSDDSDQENTGQENVVKDSAVASLEALITNARHESDGNKESVTNSNSSSDALSWLSKAQQEEYNSLMKILAKKQQIQPSQNKVKEAAALTLLKRKMLIAKKNLEKEKELMNYTMKELFKKKRAFMLAKMKTQNLKDQLLAAERVRKSNLQLWTKCSVELETLKKSVSKRQAIIDSLVSKISIISPDFDTNNVLPISISNDASGIHNLPL